MLRFRYEDAILTRFSSLRGGVILALGVRGGPTPPALAEAFRGEQERVLGQLGERSLAEVESLAAWRQAFRSFGVDPTQQRSAAEALLRRLTKKGAIPGVNLLVDLGNLVSIRYALPVAVLDARGVTGAITVRFSTGQEPFTELDSDGVRHPSPGEVIFVDEAGEVCARRWCWRQSARSAALETTTEALITVEGHHGRAEEDVTAALEDLKALLTQFAGGLHVGAILGADAPEFSAG